MLDLYKIAEDLLPVLERGEGRYGNSWYNDYRKDKQKAISMIKDEIGWMLTTKFDGDDDRNKIGDYTFQFISGYTGEEDGPRDINFVCKVNDTYYKVNGYYDSWSDGEIYWDSAVEVKNGKLETVERVVTQNVLTLKDEDGEVLYEEVVGWKS